MRVLFVDGPKAGETMVFPEERGDIRFREIYHRPTFLSGEEIPKPGEVNELVYKPFMRGVYANMALYSLHESDPWLSISEVLTPILKIAAAETKRQQRAQGILP